MTIVCETLSFKFFILYFTVYTTLGVINSLSTCKGAFPLRFYTIFISESDLPYH